MEERREKILSFLHDLRERIIQEVETLETQSRFLKKPWKHEAGGGGEIGLLRGEVFEKAAVNWSGVSGPNFPTGEAKGPFFATGVSLIFHMRNPHAPTVHMNVRYIETKEGYWFGGGYDLTPMGFPYEEDTLYFHEIAKKNLDLFSTDLYPKFSQNAKEYFYIPHRKKERGVGGIFFDHYHTEDFSQDFLLWASIGNTFLDCIMPIYKKRILHSYTEEEKQKQLEHRAHYVEFNLLYDRGTKFGFLSNGNPEAILCSMPPLASW